MRPPLSDGMLLSIGQILDDQVYQRLGWIGPISNHIWECTICKALLEIFLRSEMNGSLRNQRCLVPTYLLRPCNVRA